VCPWWRHDRRDVVDPEGGDIGIAQTVAVVLSRRA
jgi:hypothetical protein